MFGQCPISCPHEGDIRKYAAEQAQNDKLTDRSALERMVSLLARWSEKHDIAAKEANDLRNSNDFGYHLAKRDTLADCIYDLRRAIRAGKKANK